MKKNLYYKLNHYDTISLNKNSNNEIYKSDFDKEILLNNNAS